MEYVEPDKINVHANIFSSHYTIYNIANPYVNPV